MLCLAIQHLPIAIYKDSRSYSKPISFAKSKGTLGLGEAPKLALDPLGAVAMARNGNEATVILTSGASGRISALISFRALTALLRVVSSFILLLLTPFGRRRTASVVGPGGCQGSGGGGNGREEKQLGTVVRVPSAMVPRKSAVEQEVAARRALAIKRVKEDDDRKTTRDFALFVTSRGATMFTQSWTPVSCEVRGLVVLLHGLNEHSGRYSDFAKQLNANGYKVYGMDWIGAIVLGTLAGTFGVCLDKIGRRRCITLLTPEGHGGSDGLHAYVHSLDAAVGDAKSFIRKVVAENPRCPCFCFGHSTGAAIILKAALDPDVKALIAGVVVTSPAVGVQPSHPIFAVLAPVFSFLLPRFQLSAANKRGITVSRDPEALLAKYSDPLVFTGSIRVRTGYEILRITAYLQQNLKRLTTPFLVLHGTADSVTDPKASQKLYEEASSTDKTIRMLDGLLHDLLFEPEKVEIVQDILQWLNQRA